MHHRAEYLLQVLEKIGAPLMTSVIAVNAGHGESGPLFNEAQKIAELLAKTVQTSIEMSYALDLGPTGQISDSVRVALTGLAGPLVGQSFKSNAKAPGDAEIKRMVAALQAVLSFAENFEANSENAGSLKNIAASGQSVDAAQGYVQYIQAFIPVIGAISAFPFGQPEQKLIMEVSSRLTAKAETMRTSMFSDLGGDNKRVELGILKALAEIYAACHAAETMKLQAMDESRRAQSGLSMDNLWKNFETQVAMLEALAKGMAPAKGAASGSGGGGGFRPVLPQEAPVQSAPPMVLREAPPHNPPQAPPQAPPQTGGSPMSFFKTPPKSS